jgi:hypothetical protein
MRLLIAAMVQRNICVGAKTLTRHFHEMRTQKWQ